MTVAGTTRRKRIRSLEPAMEEAGRHHLSVVGSSSSTPSREEYLRAVFGSEGFLAGRFDGYRIRKGQVELAKAVEHCISKRKHLFAEGPTGTGKSLAYCVPASYEAAHGPQDDNIIVIATANIALQEQLVEKDLPLLKEILPWEVDFALLKGIGNYLCLDEMYGADAARGRLFSGNEDDLYERIRKWADETTTGDKSDLPFDPGAEWVKFSTTRDECKGDKCDQADECFARKTQKRAKQAKIIVTNYHMLFAHLRVQLETDGLIGVLPVGISTVIMDEVHKAADIAREFFGFEIRRGAVRRLARKIDDMELKAQLEEDSNSFFNELTYLKDDPDRYRTRLKKKEPIDDSYKNVCESLLASSEWFAEEAERIWDPPKRSKEAKKKREYELAAKRCREIAGSIDSAMHLKDDPNVVYHLEKDQSGSATLKAKVVNIGPILQGLLFGQHRVICTSATLAGVGGSFDFAMKELGAPEEDCITLLAESPFDFREQGLLVVPSDLPMPQKEPERYREAVARYTAKAIELAGGRTLCLFTSYRNLSLAHDYLRPRCKHRLLRQGEMPRTKLIEIFKEDKNSVLLGTESFWAGVDVPGEALSCVVIDRIPFPTPDDPVLDAISDHNDNWFFDYSVPRAQIQLKQGVGRLIRSVTDRGVVVMLDRRLIDKSYGRQFIRALPPFLKTRDISAVKEFLG